MLFCIIFGSYPKFPTIRTSIDSFVPRKLSLQPARCPHVIHFLLNLPAGAPVRSQWPFEAVAFLSHFCRTFQAPPGGYNKKKPTIQSAFETVNRGFFFGALEGTRIPGPLIKSQMLYRLSYERIHYKAQYNTILPNNITILPGKKQAFCTKNFPKAVIGQILPRTAPLQTGQEPVQSKQFITKLQPTCRAHFRAGQADPIGGLFP